MKITSAMYEKVVAENFKLKYEAQTLMGIQTELMATNLTIAIDMKNKIDEIEKSTKDTIETLEMENEWGKTATIKWNEEMAKNKTLDEELSESRDEVENLENFINEIKDKVYVFDEDASEYTDELKVDKEIKNLVEKYETQSFVFNQLEDLSHKLNKKIELQSEKIDFAYTMLRNMKHLAMKNDNVSLNELARGYAAKDMKYKYINKYDMIVSAVNEFRVAEEDDETSYEDIYSEFVDVIESIIAKNKPLTPRKPKVVVKSKKVYEVDGVDNYFTPEALYPTGMGDFETETLNGEDIGHFPAVPMNMGMIGGVDALHIVDTDSLIVPDLNID